MSQLDTSDSRIQFSWAQEWCFVLKELRETLRDRRTIITLLAMPVLLYPLLGLGFRFLAFQQSSQTQPQYQFAVNTELEANRFSELVALGKKMVAQKQMQDGKPSNPPTQPLDGITGQNLVDGRSAPAGEAEPEIMVFLPENSVTLDLESLVSEGRADLGLRLKEITSGSSVGLPQFEIELIANQGSQRSTQAAEYVTSLLDAAGKEIFRRWLSQQRVPFTEPIETRRLLVSESSGGSAALSLLPLILLLMTVTGGVYPAIDLTAGERERNTLETLISLPVPKIRLLLAKFVAVVTVTMLTGLMNLIAMFVTLYSLQLDTTLLGPQGFTLGLSFKLFLVLFAFALFYSAILLFLTSSARSFKEAQAYLIPLLLLSIGPGLIILIPGWTLGTGSAVLPLFNILLLSRDLLTGQASFLPSVVTILSTLLYGLAALALAAQIFGTDAVAVGSRSLWSDLLKRPATERSSPSVAIVLAGLAALFPAYFVASGLLSRTSDVSPTYRLAMSAMLTVVLFAGIPWAILRWQRIPLGMGLAIRGSGWQYLLLAGLLGLSVWPLIFEIVVILQSLGIQSLDISRFAEVEQLLQGWATIPLPLILLAMAVAPGVCEEMFFRGFLFGGLRPIMSGLATVCFTAVAFGLFHFVLAGGAAPERILPSMLMGLLLGWVRLRSDSLIPGVLLHILHNASLLSLSTYRDELAGWGLGGLHAKHLPTTWLVASAVVTTLALAGLAVLTRKPNTQTVDQDTA
jgi:ABC-2 type transport system permease protein/sodium transport system permease protein